MMKFLNFITQCSICAPKANKKELNLEHLNKTSNEENNIESGGNNQKDKDIKSNNQIEKNSTINRILNEEFNLNQITFQNKERSSNANIIKNLRLENINEKEDKFNMTVNHEENNFIKSYFSNKKENKNEKLKEENKEEHKIKKVRKHLMEDLF